MASDLLLIDTDAFVLLAGAGQLDRLLQMLGITSTQCRRLPSLPFVFRKRIAATLPDAIMRRIEAVIDRIAPLELAPSAALLQRLKDARDIDSGEAVLYGVLAERPASLLTTNDKRSMRALCSDPALEDVRDAVAGRVIAVEAVVSRLILENGVHAVAPGFCELAHRNAFLRIVFTEANMAAPDGCAMAVESYLNHLLSGVGDDFLFRL